MFAHAGVLLESRCVGAACPGVASSRASSSACCVSCGWHRPKLLKRLLKWLFLLRSGSFLFRSSLIANLSWNVPASFQVMLKKAMTAFSLTTRDIVEPIHLDATSFIGTHSSLDEGVPQWALPLLALKRRIWQNMSMFCYQWQEALN